MNTSGQFRRIGDRLHLAFMAAPSRGGIVTAMIATPGAVPKFHRIYVRLLTRASGEVLSADQF
jgi:hypothetical protein